MGSLLSLNIVDGTIETLLVVASVVMLAYLVSHRVPPRRFSKAALNWRHPRRSWSVRVGLAALAGAAVAVAIIFVLENLLNVFDSPIEIDINTWFVVALAAVGVAVLTLWRSRWWRRVIGAFAIVLFLTTATVGINASYGLNTTVASLLGIDIGRPIALPPTTPIPSPTKSPVAVVALPLWKTWVAPASMPATGTYGTVTIPNPASGFAARPAYLYLPPAALVPNPPALPLLIMMMGQPGGPDSSIKFLPALNELAAANHGLGPIVLTVDQIGSPTQNPLCIDSPRGNSHTYVMTDVIDYVRKNLHVSTNRQDWAIGGYSNGGECALSFGAQYPETFGSILDVSGEIGPSLGSPQLTLKIGFAGDQARYDAEQPLNIMKDRQYTNMFAIFTSGSNDHYYGPEVDTADAAAQAAGMTTRRFVGQGVGHRADAIVFGVPVGLRELYPRWQLSAPTP